MALRHIGLVFVFLTAAKGAEAAESRLVGDVAQFELTDQFSKVGDLAETSTVLIDPQCFELIGCPHKDRIFANQIQQFSCENLCLVRNTIFHQRGYCFQTARGRAQFDNSRCFSDSVSELNLTPVEKENVATIREIETHKGCE